MPGAEVVVVGAGIVGASVAYHAAAAGARVTVLAAPMPTPDATSASFGWIGGPREQDAVDGSTPLRRVAVQEWRRLERDVPAVRVRWTGSLSWGGDGIGAGAPAGEGERILNEAEIRSLEPNLRVPPERAVLRPTDGAVDAADATRALLAAARGRGAEIRSPTTATGLDLRSGVVTGVRTADGSIAAGRIVLAAGVGTRALCVALGVDLPVIASPAILVRLLAPAGLVRTLTTYPQEARQDARGRVLVPWDASGPTTEAGLRRTAEDRAQVLAATFVGGAAARLLDVRTGSRPMPEDGLPIIGPVPGRGTVHVAVMHSAVTLGPIAGRLVADEVLDRGPAGELAGVRPDRFG